ncbi:MAG: hypothetical protein ACRC6G_02545, partial [Deefgea sp.]
MKIQHSDLKLSSEHQLLRESTLQLQLNLSAEAANAFSKQLAEQISALLPRANAQADEPEALTLEKSKAQRFQSLLELLFGNGEGCCHPPQAATAMPTVDEAPLNTPASTPTAKLQLIAVEKVRESEQCSFAANGKVCLADGSSRQFAVNYQLSRDTEITRAMGAEWFDLQDPLVLDFGAPTAQLNEKSVEFDLDSDGQKEWMRMPSASSAFLFFDRNRNGLADNGSELFGPKSGHGFTELAALDEDQNGWIDEGDAAFKDLKLWQAAVHGDGVQTLAQAGVGALAVA